MEMYIFKISLNKTTEMFCILQNIYYMALTENNTIKAVGKRHMRILTVRWNYFAYRVSISKSTITLKNVESNVSTLN